MNPKQLACVVLMMFIGAMVYFGQIVHKKVSAMKKDAETAEQASTNAANGYQLAEILATKTKAETDDLRRFLTAWTPHIERSQTTQEVDSAVDFSLRERGITLVRNRKPELKNARDNKLIPRSLLTTITVEDEYAKVMNWLGDIERRLPLARVTACRVTGGSNARQVKLDVSIEAPLINLAHDAGQQKPGADKKKKS